LTSRSDPIVENGSNCTNGDQAVLQYEWIQVDGNS
jgi:hypothetical protein